MAGVRGRVFSVQSFSIHDGPGIRTTVFFQGCNLRCLWCHNPESWPTTSSLLFHRELCTGCGACAAACPQGVHRVEGAADHTLDRERCRLCGRCAGDCFSGALELAGREMDAEAIMALIRADAPYFAHSEGGVTFSGGEPMLQLELLEALLDACRAEGIHTAVDTAAAVDWTGFVRIMDLTDLFLVDLKAIDPQRHRRLTGVDNAQVLANLRSLHEAGQALRVRVPCVPGLNWDELPAIADWLGQLGPLEVELLGYHVLGEDKRVALDGRALTLEPPTDEAMAALRARFAAQGLRVIGQA